MRRLSYGKVAVNKSFLRFVPQPVDAWLVISAFIVITIVLLVVGQGRILHYVFPAIAVSIGLYLYHRYPLLYSGFVWWIWFLAAFVRRLADYKSTFTEPNPILLAPFLVTLIPIIGLLKTIPRAGREGYFPFVVAFFGLGYSFIIGAINFSFKAAIISGLEWFSPVVFGCYLFFQWRDYPQYKRHIRRVFLVAALTTGGYGIYQYLVAPAWDCLWLANVDLISAGRPEPQGMRIWSTMHSHGVFAGVMMASLLLLLSDVRPLGLIASSVGYLSFLLTSSRTVWLGWAVGLFTLILTLKSRLKVKLLIFCAITLILIIPLTQIKPFSEQVLTRIQTFSDIRNDGSFEARKDIYKEDFDKGLMNIMGEGLNKSNGFDSGLITMLISLGWIGTSLYLLGLLLCVHHLENSLWIARDQFAATSKAIFYGTFMQMLGGSTMLGLPGMIMWGFAGLALAASKYHFEQRHHLLLKMNLHETISADRSLKL